MNQQICFRLRLVWLASVLAILVAGPAFSAEPVADGWSEVRHGTIQRIDLGGGIVVVDGRTYTLLENHDQVIGRVLGDSALDRDTELTLQQLSTGDQIRFAVDLLSEQIDDRPAVLFVLGAE